MASASIIIQKNSDGNLVPGSRDDLAIGDTVTLINANNTNVGLWNWTMFSVPAGSSAVLSSSSAPSVSFVIDGYIGTFLVRLQINNTLTNEVGIGVKSNNFGYRIPAMNESTQFNTTTGGVNTNGWSAAMNDALNKIDASALRDGYGTSTLPFAFDGITTFNSRAIFGNEVALNHFTTASTTITMDHSYNYVGMSNASARTVTLCAAAAVDPGFWLLIKDEAGTGGSANITINRAGSDTIDGATSKVINSNYGVIKLISDGSSKWFTV